MAVSPKLSDTGPGRLEIALQEMDKAPDGKGVPTPRLQTLQSIANQHGLDILRATVGTNVSPALVLALISVESAGQTQATSGAGAQGLMQLMPATAARFGVTDSMNPADNIKGGVAYLAWLMKHFDNDPILVLAGYNAGEGAFGFSKTRYLTKILIPYSLPHIITGLRLSISVAWLVIVAGEMLSGGAGIGFFVWDSWNALSLEKVISAIIIIGIVGLLFDKLFTYIESKVAYQG